MSGVNRVILVGNLGKDPESKTIGTNTVTNFTLATSESWTDKEGQKQDRVEWHRVSCFGKLAEITAKYLTKGRQCYVEGKLRTREYEKDGVKKYSTDIIAERVEFLGSARETSEETTTETTTPVAAATTAKTKKPFNHAPGAINDEFGF